MIVTLNTDNAQIEYGIIEFQGEVRGELRGELGRVKMNEASGRADIQLGNCLIGGKVVSLQKPLVVLQKNGVVVRAVGFVRSKLVFDSRPEYIHDVRSDSEEN